MYQAAPVRNFLIENRDGPSPGSGQDKWLYWGLIHIIESRLDSLAKTTSGKFIIKYLYTPEQMRLAHDILDRDPKTNFFAK